MQTFRFIDFPVYQEAKTYYSLCIGITQPFPRAFWELGDQLRRAALSICLNIAEGSAKYSDKDFKRYIENALGSVNETYACLEIATTHTLIKKEIFLKGKTHAESIARQLGGLSKKLRSAS